MKWYEELAISLMFIMLSILISAAIFKIDKIEKQIDRGLKGGHLTYPYQGWTYGVPCGVRGDTLVLYKYVDSIYIWTEETDTIKIRKKWEVEE